MAIGVMRLGLHRDLRKIRQDFRRATPRSTGARVAAKARLRVFSVGVNVEWQKSSFSTDAEGNCLELATHGDEILVRESDSPDVIVKTTRAKLEAFLTGAKAGEFDHLA